MVYYTKIKKTKHYIEYHEKGVHWHEVIKVILNSHKNIKKKGSRLEIETKNCYILCKLKENTLYIINAKRK